MIENQCDIEACGCNGVQCSNTQFCDTSGATPTCATRTGSNCPPNKVEDAQGTRCNISNLECCDLANYDKDGDGFVDCGCSFLDNASCTGTVGCTWAAGHCTGMPDITKNVVTCGNLEAACGIQCCDIDDNNAAVAPCPGTQTCDPTSHTCK